DRDEHARPLAVDDDIVSFHPGLDEPVVVVEGQDTVDVLLSFWRCTVPRRMKYSRSWTVMTFLMSLADRPSLPSITIRSMLMRRPVLITKATRTSPSENFSTSGVICASK